MQSSGAVENDCFSSPDLTVQTSCVPITKNGSAPPPPSITSNRASSRKNRVHVFRRFLLETYGHTPGCVLSKGSTVLDVAGGKGDLSWLLKTVDNVNSIVVDPRPTLNHSSLVKSVTYLRNNPAEAARRAIPNLPTHQPLASLLPKLEGKQLSCFQSPRHLRILVDDALVAAVQHQLLSSGTDREAWNVFWKNALKRTSNSLSSERNSDEQLSSSAMIVNAQEALEVITSAKLIVGFHPDQATEACMDLAHVLGVPYSVVPCCVFPSEFPHRTIMARTRTRMPLSLSLSSIVIDNEERKDGQAPPARIRVRTYDQFVLYLRNKNHAIQSKRLDFFETATARNLVLYTTR